MRYGLDENRITERRLAITGIFYGAKVTVLGQRAQRL
jgi:hypothetical protein